MERHFGRYFFHYKHSLELLGHSVAILVETRKAVKQNKKGERWKVKIMLEEKLLFDVMNVFNQNVILKTNYKIYPTFVF